MILNNISQDLLSVGVPPVIYAVQGDRMTREVEISLFSGGEEFLVPDGSRVTIGYKKRDGHGGIYDSVSVGESAYEIGGNKIKIVLAPQVLTSPGDVCVTVGIFNGERALHTFPFLISVTPNPSSDAVSEDFFSVGGVVPYSGWTPNKFLGTDENGNVIATGGPGGGVTDEHINSLIDAKLGVIENGSY